MDFWSQLKKSGQEVAGKAKDLAEVTRLQLAQKELERKLEQLYTQLGKSFYEATVQGQVGEFSQLLEFISQTQDEIAASKEQQQILKGNVRCTACGALMESGALFCPQCGMQREFPQELEVVDAPETGKIFCPNCGNQVEHKAFCVFCGTKLI